MANVYVYAPDAEDLDCLGLCGPLTATMCKHTEEANGMSQIELEHPIDAAGRWSFLQDGYILKAEVPVRTCPEIEAGALVTSIETWHVKPGATKAQRYIYSKASGGKKKKLLSVGTQVFVTKKAGTRYKCRTGKYSGYIPVSGIEYDLVQTIPNDPAAIEQVVPAWTVRPQLFRIFETDLTDQAVKVKARHIFYDMLGNITTYAADNPTCGAALEGILSGCAVAHEIEGYTNMADTRVGIDWTRVNPVDALLAPDTGLVARWQGELVRDDQEFYVLDEAGLNRGVRIAYGKNLTGVQCTLDTTNIITRIMPVGQTSKGKPLLLAPGTYTVDGKTVVIDSSLTVASSRDGNYATPHAMVLDLGTAAKAAGTTSAQVLAARVKMIRAALAKFSDEEVDLPSLTLTVDFVKLGDTVEYQRYKSLEDAYLYDRVRVFHPKIGIDVLTAVKRMVFDCLQGRFDTVELGAVRRDLSRVAVATWQLPVIPGTLVGAGSLGAGAFADDAATGMDLTVNPASWLISILSSAGMFVVGVPANSTVLTAQVTAGGTDITGHIDAARFYWTRSTTDAAADAAWAAAHTGVKSVMISAAERTVKAVYTCWIEEE